MSEHPAVPELVVKLLSPTAPSERGWASTTYNWPETSGVAGTGTSTR